MKKRSKAKKDVCQEADDWCFLCKDGGDLIICDRKEGARWQARSSHANVEEAARGCLKVYHAKCAGKDDTSTETEKRWSCDRHTCFVCRKSAKIYCFCCPNAVCGRCNSAAEFAQIRGNGGFCDECLKLILLIEEKADYDSDGEKLDFDDRDTHECLFKEYWEIVKEREGLTLEIAYHADARLKKGKNYSSDCDPTEIFDSEGTDESASDEDGKVKRSQGEQTDESTSEDDKIDKVKRPRSKGKKSSNRFQEFEGWGSKPLIHFLKSIGEDTAKELSRFDVDTIISRYIQANELSGPGKRRRVRCDEKLYAIFKKKTVNRNKIYHLLEPHFMEMVVSSGEDEKDNSDGTTAGVRAMKAIRSGKKRRALDSKRKSKAKEAVPKVREVPKIQESCFAAINVDNLKLVYLRRSSVEELLKQPHTVEGKIIGSFVKVKRDLTYHLQSSSHQLLLVTGLKQGSNANKNAEILLEVSNLSKPISIKMLSDTDLSEEECEDLRQRVENGNLKKLTVEELQQKATSLHEVITKLSIEKEIVLLQHLIDQANEKGWRREKDLYLEKKALLKTPSEQERRLKQIPKVTSEAVRLKAPASSPSLEDDSEAADSPQSLMGTPNSPGEPTPSSLGT